MSELDPRVRRARSSDKTRPLSDWAAPFLRDGEMDGRRQGNAEIVLSRSEGDEHTGAEDGRRAAAAKRRHRSSRDRGDGAGSARGGPVWAAPPSRIGEPRA